MSNYKVGDLLHLIPADVLNEKLRQINCELEPGFLCFEENYVPIANNVPKEFTVVDIGCYMAAQSYLFKEFERYYGVDPFDLPFNDDYIAPERFAISNGTHFCLSGKQFLDSFLSSLDLDKTYFICSAVPNFKETDYIFDSVKNCAIFYPGKEPMVKGISKEAILSEYENLKDHDIFIESLHKR